MRKAGIDYDSRQITLVVLNGKDKIYKQFQVISEKDNFPERFNELEDKFLHLIDVEDLMTEGIKFTVEDSIYTKNPRATLELAQMKGMILGFFNYFNMHYSLVAPQEWKKKVLGKAVKGKEGIKEFVMNKYPDLKTNNEHLYDAICIALSGGK